MGRDFTWWNMTKHRFTQWCKHWWQRRTRGFDDSQTWSLDHTIAVFTLPRLRRFKELNNGYPHGFTEDSWNEAIDDMIYSLEASAHEWDPATRVDEVDWSRVHRGSELMGKHFRDLWW